MKILAGALVVFAIVSAAVAASSYARVGELDLPALEHGLWIEPEGGVRSYQICGKLLQETARAEHYVETMERFIEEYGHRAKLAERNEGIDWKAISHALRAGYQTYYILTQRGFEYPLPETDYLVKVKRGEVPFAEASETLEVLIDLVERLSASSPLPERADRDWWERWLVSVVGRAVYVGLEPKVRADRFLEGLP